MTTIDRGVDMDDSQAKCCLCGEQGGHNNQVAIEDKVYCTVCLKQLIASKPSSHLTAGNSFLVFVLSLLPGLGHLYLGIRTKGFQLILLFFGSMALTQQFNSLEQFAVFIFPALLVYSIFDARYLRQQILAGEIVNDSGFFTSGKQLELLAILLIALGGFEAIKYILSDYPGFFTLALKIERLLPPMIMMLAGVYFLRKQRDLRY